jgi:hypothetical protein
MGVTMAQMTKKNFEALAEALRERCPNYVVGDDDASLSTRHQRVGWFQAVSAVTSVCEANNPRFDRERFYRACGIEVAE